MSPQRLNITAVEVEVNSRCNRKCSYCPVSILPIPTVPRYMDDPVFEKLLDELVGIDFAGRFSYHFYNEPLLRRDLERLIRRVAHRLPKAFQVLYTNGDLLTEQRYKSLIEAGIDYFKVTSHSLKPHPERPFQLVQLPTDLELTNRGGLLTHLPEATSDTRCLPCYAPSEMLIITVTGDVVLCYEDAEREHVMGNIVASSLPDIWFSENFVRIRQMLVEGKRTEASNICKPCTNICHRTPGNSFM
jgi:GTP 3',8-cyclase